ncbi:MAG: pentapeptide repeat-containing protein [Bryobacteraceae bacterium]|nr:pentapeptide repeat-containing protein [Solibacteraceae bacterium]MCO5351879.1 pentapeptide repeat-containing protein [Bryobacteraceae bacterium]
MSNIMAWPFQKLEFPPEATDSKPGDHAGPDLTELHWQPPPRPADEAPPALAIVRQALSRHSLWLNNTSGGQQAELEGHQLEQPRLGAVRMDRALLRRLSWPGAQMIGSSWIEVEAALCDFSLSHFGPASMSASRWAKSKLDMASLSGADLCEALLEECSFEQVKAAGSRWMETRLSRVNFTGAHLRQAAFHQAHALECNFTGADLEESLFYRAELQLCRFQKVRGPSLNFGVARLQHCDFSEASLRDARFGRARVIVGQFLKCDLRGADFRGADLRACTFSGAQLDGARFLDARTYGADFRGANLSGARDLSARQLAQALTDPATTLPNGLPGPYLRGSGAERPGLRVRS